MKSSLSLLLVLGALGGFLACSKDDPPAIGGTTDDAGDTDAGATVEGGSAGGQCTAARESTLKPIDKVATGAVSIVEEDATSKLLYVDGSAGGTQNASRNPYVFINLETASKVDVTDKTALESTEWDLALKRTIIFTNGGDGGPGTGGAGRVAKAFADVTDTDSAKIGQEKFFDEECNAILDQANFLTTTFSPDWYTYDEANNGVAPVENLTYVVVGGTGKKYKVAIESYTGKPDGTTTAPSGGYFLIRIGAL
jgi:hypothetical protein